MASMDHPSSYLNEKPDLLPNLTADAEAAKQTTGAIDKAISFDCRCSRAKVNSICIVELECCSGAGSL